MLNLCVHLSFVVKSTSKKLCKWTEIDRILQLNSEVAHSSCCSTISDEQNKPKVVGTWTDVWRVYEDVCIVCAGLWLGSWRGNSRASYSTADGQENWGSVRLEGDDDLSLLNMLDEPESSGANGSGNTGGKLSGNSQRMYMRNLGMGIEGRPFDSLGGLTPKSTRRASAVSWSSGKATVVALPSPSTSTMPKPSSNGPPAAEGDDDIVLPDLHPEEVSRRRMAHVSTTMALLQTFHAHTAFQLSILEDLLKQRGVKSSTTSDTALVGTGTFGALQGGEKLITLTSKDVLSFELGPFSAIDAKYLEWLAAEYAGDGVQVVIKRGWRDMFGIIFGYG